MRAQSIAHFLLLGINWLVFWYDKYCNHWVG